MKTAHLVCLAIICLPVAVHAQKPETKDLKYFLHQLYSVDNLPVLEDSHTFVSSTWDTTGGNSDGDCFKNLQGTRNILLDVDGPGCVHRIFTGVTYGFIDASTFGTKIQVFLDGNPAPLYDMDVTRSFPVSVCFPEDVSRHHVPHSVCQALQDSTGQRQSGELGQLLASRVYEVFQ